MKEGFLNVFITLNYITARAGQVVPPFEQNSSRFIIVILELLVIIAQLIEVPVNY